MIVRVSLFLCDEYTISDSSLQPPHAYSCIHKQIPKDSLWWPTLKPCHVDTLPSPATSATGWGVAVPRLSGVASTDDEGDVASAAGFPFVGPREPSAERASTGIEASDTAETTPVESRRADVLTARLDFPDDESRRDAATAEAEETDVVDEPDDDSRRDATAAANDVDDAGEIKPLGSALDGLEAGPDFLSSPPVLLALAFSGIDSSFA